MHLEQQPESEPKIPEGKIISADSLNVGTEHHSDETIGADNDNTRPYDGGRHLEKEGEQIIAAHAKKDKPGHHTSPFFVGTNIQVRPGDFAGDENSAITETGMVAHVEWREVA